MTDDEPRILESSYRESPAERPSFALEVLGAALLAAGAAYAIALALSEAFALYAAGVVCLSVLVWRLIAWDSQGRAVHVVERTQRLARRRTPERIMVTSDVGPRPRRYQVGKWSFTRSEWRRLGRAIGDKLTRRSINDVQRDNGERLFSNVTETYPEVVEELQRLGFIDGSNEVTDRGRAWFENPNSALLD